MIPDDRGNLTVERLNSAELIIHRTKSSLMPFNRMDVYLDNIKIGDIYNRTTNRFFISPGSHSIYVKVKRYKSNTLTFDASTNQIIFLECGAKTRDIYSVKSFREMMKEIKSFKKAMYLTQIDNIPEPAQIDKAISRNVLRRIQIVLSGMLLTFGIAITLLGIVGWMNGFIVAAGGAFWATPNTEMPLGDLGGIAVDKDENIYLAANFYYRIQKYSQDGEFIQGWPSNDNNPRIRINEHNQLESAGDNRGPSGDDTDILSVYDLEGNLISKEESDGCYEKFGSECERSCRGKNGGLYTIRNKWFWPHVVKTYSYYPGVEETVVKTPWYLWMILGPFPAWIFFAVGISGLGLLAKWIL